jgi:hypothetical protein
LRKLAAILLLGVLSFNWIGYRLLADLILHHAEAALEARLDQHEYDESQLIELKVTLDLPYQTSWTDFERIDGEIEINGIHYKYVKRKVQDGQLVLMCLPHESKMRLQTARDDFFKLVNDLQHPSQNKKSDNSNTASFNSFASEYYAEKNEWSLTTLLHQVPHYINKQSALQANCFISTPAQPPEA